MSGSSEAWYRARFGTGRSRIQIPPSRPLPSKGPLFATTATRTDPTTLDITRLVAKRVLDNTSEERPIQEYRGCARGAGVAVSGSSTRNVEPPSDRPLRPARAGIAHAARATPPTSAVATPYVTGSWNTLGKTLLPDFGFSRMDVACPLLSKRSNVSPLCPEYGVTYLSGRT
jgi:hypothetical protein